MRFPDTGEKVRKLRKELGIKQADLDSTGVSRNFISMIETGKRKLNYSLALKLLNIFQDKAKALGKELNIDVKWLMASSKEQAAKFCADRLKSELSSEDIDLMTSLVKDYNITNLVFKVYTLKADSLYENKLYEEAFTYYYGTLDYIDDNSEEKAFVYNKLGKCKFMMLNYIEAILYLNKCYRISLSHNYVLNRKNSLYNLALSHRKLGSIKLALQCVDECISLCDIEKEFNDYMGAVILKSNCYIDLGQYKESINILSSCIDKFKDSEDILLGYIYNSLGALYMDISEFDNALYYLDKAYHIRNAKDDENLSKTMLNKAEIYIKQRRFKEALNLIDEALVIADNDKDNDSMITACFLLEKIYIQADDTEQLRMLYFKMLDLFKITGRKDDSLKTYIKLLKVTTKTEDRNACLDEAMKLV